MSRKISHLSLMRIKFNIGHALLIMLLLIILRQMIDENFDEND